MDQGEVRGQEDISGHIVVFYKDLFGPNPYRDIILSNNFWHGHGQLSEEGRNRLIEPFTEQEVRNAIFEMKSSSAPGPNGYGTTFFKTF